MDRCQNIAQVVIYLNPRVKCESAVGEVGIDV